MGGGAWCGVCGGGGAWCRPGVGGRERVHGVWHVGGGGSRFTVPAAVRGCQARLPDRTHLLERECPHQLVVIGAACCLGCYHGYIQCLVLSDLNCPASCCGLVANVQGLRRAASGPRRLQSDNAPHGGFAASGCAARSRCCPTTPLPPPTTTTTTDAREVHYTPKDQ